MGAGDFRDLVTFIAACASVSSLISFFLGNARPSWTSRRITFLSALPVPSLVWLLCIYVFVGAATSSKEDCGVDACGMAMAFSILIAFAGIIGFGVGAACARCVRKLISK